MCEAVDASPDLMLQPTGIAERLMSPSHMLLTWLSHESFLLAVGKPWVI